MRKGLQFIILLIATVLAGCDGHSTPEERWEQAVEGASAGALSPEGKYSLLSSIHHDVVVWDNQKRGLQYLWKTQEGDNPIYLSRITHNGEFAVLASREDFSVWSMQTGKPLGWYQLDHSTIRDIALSNSGTQVLVGRSDGVVVHINLQTGRRIEFLGHSERINAVDLSPNGRYALSGGNDYVAYMWDTETGQVIHRFVHSKRVTQVRFHPQGSMLLTADAWKHAFIWRLPDGKRISELAISTRQHIFSAARFSDDGKLLATGSPSKRLTLWDVTSGKQIQSWQVSSQQDIHWRGAVVYDVAFSGNWLYSVSSAGYTEVWPLPDEAR